MNDLRPSIDGGRADGQVEKDLVRQGLKETLERILAKAKRSEARYNGNPPTLLKPFMDSINLELSQFGSQTTERLEDRIKDFNETLLHF